MTEQPWLTTSQFAAYWRDHPPTDGRGPWVLNTVPMNGPPDPWFYALVDVYATPLDALADMADSLYGPDITARLVWQRPSGLRDHFWEAWGIHTDEDGLEHEYGFFLLEAVPTRATDRSLGELEQAIRLSPATDPYPPA